MRKDAHNNQTEGKNEVLTEPLGLHVDARGGAEHLTEEETVSLSDRRRFIPISHQKVWLVFHLGPPALTPAAR